MTCTLMTIGECMVEMAPGDDGRFAMGFAGDMFNSAWYARQVAGDGLRVAFLSAIGDDAVSAEMERFIRAAGVEPLLSVVPGNSVGLYLISLTDGERSFSYWRGQSAAKTLADDPAWLDDLLTNRDLIHFSGITLAILSPDARQAFCKALAKARANGTHVSFDTNLRPRLWEDARTMAKGLRLGASVADTVLPSFDEEQLCFGDSHPDDTIHRYRDLGATTVAVKNGSEMVHLWSQAEGDDRYDPPSVPQVIDSTAAGDSFAAGFFGAIVTALVIWNVGGALIPEGASENAWLSAVPSRDLGGFMLNMMLGVTCVSLSVPLGIALALGRQSNMPLIKWVCVIFIEFIRGVPLITLLFVASVMLAYFFPPDSTVDLFLRVVIMITMFSSAYIAEVIRGGLAALPRGQYEAADSLGLDYPQAMRLIILPQALKISIPGIVNVAVGLFKDTTLVSVISMFDLVGMIRGPILASTEWNGVYWELLGFAALLFFVVCYGISQYSQWLERRLATDHR